MFNIPDLLFNFPGFSVHLPPDWAFKILRITHWAAWAAPPAGLSLPNPRVRHAPPGRLLKPRLRLQAAMSETHSCADHALWRSNLDLRE